MKIEMNAMKEKVQTLTNELLDKNNNEKVIEIIVHEGLNTIEDQHNVVRDTKTSESNKKEEPKLNFDICKHKLKTEKALVKLMNIKHEG